MHCPPSRVCQCFRDLLDPGGNIGQGAGESGWGGREGQCFIQYMGVIKQSGARLVPGNVTRWSLSDLLRPRPRTRSGRMMEEPSLLLDSTWAAQKGLTAPHLHHETSGCVTGSCCAQSSLFLPLRLIQAPTLEAGNQVTSAAAVWWLNRWVSLEKHPLPCAHYLPRPQCFSLLWGPL